MDRTLHKDINAYLRLRLTPIPGKPKDEEPLVKCRNGWNPTYADLKRRAEKPNINWAVRCDRNFAALDFDSEDAYYHLIEGHRVPPTCPIVRTGRGFHTWVRTKKPVRSQRPERLETRRWLEN